jgi:ADP-L-glycero-D-manno-heptose 6-epimerase
MRHRTNQQVIVTGAAGFIGARLVQALGRDGRPVVSVDSLSAFTSRPEHQDIAFGEQLPIEAIGPRLAAIDPRDEAGRPSAIVHLGACTDTREQDRALLQRVNIDASKQLWEQAVRLQVPLIYASSAATYGDGTRGYDDDEAHIAELRALNPYGESKQVFDEWVLEQVGLRSAPPAWCGLKFFNVYGFGERHKESMASVVLHAFDQIRATGTLKLFKSHRPDVADGHQARDFVFVDDVVNVIRFLLDEPPARGIFNVGSGRARTFLDLGRAVFASLNADERIEFIDTPIGLRAQYQYFTEARIDRLRTAGYREPFTSLEEGVARYVAALKDAVPA